MNQAELILNREGEIYHLGLKPGQLAERILLVGDPARVHRIGQLLARHWEVEPVVRVGEAEADQDKREAKDRE